jgi:hypothetical protein
MENKYFTPDIEDICIGYECEVYSIGLQMINDRLLPDDERDNELKWRPRIIKCGSDILSLEAHSYQNEDELYKSFKTLWKNYIRVPYLTKEQIEAEGWEYKSRGTDLWFERKEIFLREDGYHLENIKLQYGLHDCRLKISFVYIGDGEESTGAYLGKCKDINTFRKIIKLLNIN